MQTIKLKKKAYIQAGYSIVGPLEGIGPLGQYFDYVIQDDTLREKTFEKSERKLLQNIIVGAADKAGLNISDIELFFGGDLLNQIVSSSYAARELSLPFIGVYSACATMAEALALAAIFVSNNIVNNVVAGTCTHFSSAERQYRFPLELGNQRPPTAQRTITGGGATVVSNKRSKICISAVTIGKVIDYGIADVNNMGAAMAPAALATIKAHFSDMNTSEKDFDLIVTGDLGQVGKDALLALARKEGLSLAGKLEDCGTLVFDLQRQDVHAGGSGCGCSAITLCSELLNKLNSGKLKKILFCGTGALLSPTSTQQGLAIPGVCHAVCIRGGNG